MYNLNLFSRTIKEKRVQRVLLSKKLTNCTLNAYSIHAWTKKIWLIKRLIHKNWHEHDFYEEAVTRLSKNYACSSIEKNQITATFKTQ